MADQFDWVGAVWRDVVRVEHRFVWRIDHVQGLWEEVAEGCEAYCGWEDCE